jgi:uncharacterized Zn finger protein (UPF0148 family)
MASDQIWTVGICACGDLLQDELAAEFPAIIEADDGTVLCSECEKPFEQTEVVLKAQHDALYSAVKEEVEQLRGEIADALECAAASKTRPVSRSYHREADRLEAQANRLQAILDRTSLQAGREG